MGLDTYIYQLVEGDVKETIPKYLEDNIGFRISFLYCDMDIVIWMLKMQHILHLKNYLIEWLKGVLLFSMNMHVKKWGESNTVDKFMKNHPELEIKTTHLVRPPSAYIIKK